MEKAAAAVHSSGEVKNSLDYWEELRNLLVTEGKRESQPVCTVSALKSAD